MAFQEWKRDLLLIMKERYGLNENDFATESRLKNAFDCGDSPEEYSECQARKHDLDRIDVSAYGY